MHMTVKNRNFVGILGIVMPFHQLEGQGEGRITLIWVVMMLFCRSYSCGQAPALAETTNPISKEL
jgi:hypothetical protein